MFLVRVTTKFGIEQVQLKRAFKEIFLGVESEAEATAKRVSDSFNIHINEAKTSLLQTAIPLSADLKRCGWKKRRA